MNPKRFDHERDCASGTRVVGIHVGVHAEAIGEQLSDQNFKGSSQTVRQWRSGGGKVVIAGRGQRTIVAHQNQFPEAFVSEIVDQILVIDVPGVPVNPVDTIGAGDSFNAGFLCAYLNGKDIATCARGGNIAGSLSTLAAGGTESYRNRSLCEAFLRDHAFPVTNDQATNRTSR